MMGAGVGRTGRVKIQKQVVCRMARRGAWPVDQMDATLRSWSRRRRRGETVRCIGKTAGGRWQEVAGGAGRGLYGGEYLWCGVGSEQWSRGAGGTQETIDPTRQETPAKRQATRGSKRYDRQEDKLKRPATEHDRARA